MNWWRSFFPERDPDETPRLARLASEGRTVELDDVGPADTVLIAIFGYGDEYWRVDADYQIDARRGELLNAQLILEHGGKLRDPTRLAFLANPPRRLTFRS